MSPENRNKIKPTVVVEREPGAPPLLYLLTERDPAPARSVPTLCARVDFADFDGLTAVVGGQPEGSRAAMLMTFDVADPYDARRRRHVVCRASKTTTGETPSLVRMSAFGGSALRFLLIWALSDGYTATLYDAHGSAERSWPAA